MTREAPKYYFFLGIGGIGMSALARFYNAQGIQVLGYDKTTTPLTQKLASEGIEIYFNDNPKQLAKKYSPENTVVIYTPAVPTKSAWYTHFSSQNYTIIKRAEALGGITKNTHNLSVAGTHGKTTTSAIVGHIMEKADQEVTAFLGGILQGKESNLILKGNKYSVTEADEFDRSFLHLHPHSAVLTSMDADHMDIYKNETELHKSFEAFGKNVSTNFITKKGLPITGTHAYSITEDADFCAKNITITNGKYQFDLNLMGEEIAVELSTLGLHNVENAVAAAALCYLNGINKIDIKLGLESFKGVRRRFNRYDGSEKIYIDDYAHHPSELEAMQQSLQMLFPDKKTLVIFQPHLFSRTKDFMEDFITVLNKFEHLILLEIYPAREEPIPGITSSRIGDSLNKRPIICNLEDVLDRVKKQPNVDVIVSLGAGNIDRLIEPLKLYIHA